MTDPYQTLGIAKSASAAEIKAAYRKLAKKLHPDVNPGRKDIEQKFKDVTAAYDLLSDPAKRTRYDRGEIDAQGHERGFSYAGGDPFGGMGGRSRSYRYATGDSGEGFSGFDPHDLFSELFGGRDRAARKAVRGADVNYALTVPFVEACLGGKRRLNLSSGKTIDINIPKGTNDGDKLRLREQGMPAPGGAGDAIIEIHVEPHPFFARKDNDIHLETPVSLPEAVLGANIRVPTLDGYVAIKVPKGANSGTLLRLKGKGIPRAQGEAGDMFVKLKIMLPEPVPHTLAEAIEKWAKKHPYDPRKKLGWG